ncbi:hypothetical protein [uncultured Tateyamaria sp.]|uniref:hypothetical protein n=1 Tax=uncultured Tateyamaria sp. TaxID=455651 RepID=UPI00261E5737|nr:hypothetical protein [uncultured Tateyamaria sp.]
MTLHTPGEEEARTTEALSAAHDEISSLRKAISDLTKRIEAGEDVKQNDAKTDMTSLSTMLRNCISLETQIGNLKASRSEVVQAGYAINHELAVAEIRCALGRVRACCNSGAISE